MKIKNKIKFYDNLVKIMVIGLVAPILLLFVIPERLLDIPIINYCWLGIFIIGIIGELVFKIGMAYNSFKLKKYGWMIGIIMFSFILPLMFYNSIMREKFKKIIK